MSGLAREREVVARFQIQPAPLPAAKPPGTSCRDHGGIVCVEPRGSYAHPGLSRQPLAQRADQSPVARDAAAYDGNAVPRRFDGMGRLRDQYSNRRILKCPRDIGIRVGRVVAGSTAVATYDT